MRSGSRMEDQGLMTVYRVILFDIWGNLSREFVYEGCDNLLVDGRECVLGPYARQRRESNSKLLTGEHSRN
ncbi:unnamed protein product [Calypogeia fissa]